MKTAFRLVLIAVLVGLMGAGAAIAQEEELTLRLSRDFGYGGFGGDIQGTFSMRVTGPDDLARVEFYIDDAKIGEVDSPPFRLQFVTDDYPPGVRSLWAVGTTTGGRELRSETLTATFVTKAAGTQAVLKIVVPLLVIVLGGMLVAALVAMLTGRKAKALPPGTPRQYPLGGGICPTCGRPFAFHIFGLNLLAGKFDRCPYCGRWGLVRRAPLPQLRQAEEAELAAAQAATGSEAPSGEEEALRKELDDSKYQDL